MPRTASHRTSLPIEAWTAGLVLIALTALAWAWLFRMDSASDIFLCRVGTATLPAIAAMWAVMMTAMMIPSALPMTFAYAQVTARVERPSIRLGLVALFVGIYLIVWSAFGAAAGGADRGAERGTLSASLPVTARRTGHLSSSFAHSRSRSNVPGLSRSSEILIIRPNSTEISSE